MKKIAFLIIISQLLFGCKPEVSLKKPNLLFVFSDQQSFDMLGCYGNRQIITPEIDAFAEEGILFNHCVSNSPTCTPMRGILMTGQHGLYSGALVNDLQIVPGNGNYFAEVLGAAGYNTGYVGKWHLYGGDRFRPIPAGPYRYGFDDLFLSNNCTLDFTREGSFFWNEDGEKEKYNDWEWYGQTRQALDYIDEHAHEPFALFLSWHPPHNWDGLYGYGAPEDMLELYDPDSIQVRVGTPDTPELREMYQGYMALCSSIDKSFGDLLDKLDEKGIKDNTIIVFTSDHGDFLTSYNQKWHKSEPQALSCRVPLIIRYPETLESRKSDLIFGTFDFMPTLLGMMDLEVPESCQGLDLTEAIYTMNDDAVKSSPLYQYDHNWRGIYTCDYTYAFSVLPYDETDTISNCLYDRTVDPHEQENLFTSPDHLALKKSLHQQTLAWMEKFHDDGSEWTAVLEQILSPEEYALRIAGKAYPEGSGATGALKGRPVDVFRSGNVDQ
ncbi:MAG: sulfatase-like hydrolase/transferase [Bacteroidetes bacterium]|nr:sulfatase-like hydrolase/transferase [Bacteroidota bacterium]